jgi:hypothetical protein
VEYANMHGNWAPDFEDNLSRLVMSSVVTSDEMSVDREGEAKKCPFDPRRFVPR